MNGRSRGLAGLLGLALLATGCGSSSEAESTDAAAFYQDNAITVYANGRAGGLTDTFSRLIARHWEELTGGTMNVENMEGGGGLVAINHVYAQEGDPTALGTGPLGGHVITYDLFGSDGEEYTATELNFIVNYPPSLRAAMVTVGKDHEFESVDDMIAAGAVTFGVPSPDSGQAHAVAFVSDVLGIESTLLPGYRAADIATAAAGGEYDAYAWEGSRVHQDANDGLVKQPFFSISDERSALFPDVPALTDLVDLTDEQQEKLDFISTLGEGTTMFLPPGVDDEYIQYLRTTVLEAMATDAFVEDAEAAFTLWADPLDGAGTQELVERAMNTSTQLIDDINAETASRVR